jgi:hypothetical protein
LQVETIVASPRGCGLLNDNYRHISSGGAGKSGARRIARVELFADMGRSSAAPLPECDVRRMERRTDAKAIFLVDVFRGSVRGLCLG